MKRIWRRYPGALRDMAVALTLTGAGWMDLPMLSNNRWCDGYSTPVMQEQLPLFLMRPAGLQLKQGPPWTLSSSSSFVVRTKAIFICIISSFMTQRPRHPHSWGFLITIRHTTCGITPLGDWSARRRDLYLTTHNIHDIHDPRGFQTRSPSKWANADRRLWQRGHWDRRVRLYRQLNKMTNIQVSTWRCCLIGTSYRSDGWGGKNRCPFIVKDTSYRLKI